MRASIDPPAPRRRAGLLLVVSPLAVLAGCATEGETAGAGRWQAVTDTLGDTVVVRTLQGSAWGGDARLVPEVEIGVLEGERPFMFGQIVAIAVGPDGAIHVLDRQVPEVRVFEPDGTFRGTIGRPGEGPGELRQPDSGLAVLPDGRVLVRDPGNARIQVFAPDGEPLDIWPHRGGFSTSTPLWVDRRDHVYTQILLDPTADIGDWRMGLVRIAPDGTPVDTLPVPRSGYEPPALEARMERGESRTVSRTAVPFAPSESWALHPDGYFVHGVSTAYRITLLRPDAPLRIERLDSPVPVTAGERSEETTRVTRNLRTVDPEWRWNGPPIPDVKPPFRSLHAGRDGRIWALVSLPGVEVEDLAHDPRDPDSVPDRWREPVAFDVFEPDGTYLGRVEGPLGIGTYVFDGDRVWAVARDELGVQRVVRFRVARDEETVAGTG